MLELTLSTRYEAGSNVKGSVVGAGWRFALPSLELGHCVCLGAPTEAALAALAQSSSRLTLLVDDPAAVQLPAIPQAEVEIALDPLAGGSWPAPGSADLVVLCSRRWQRRLAARRSELDRLLSPGGLLFAERPGGAVRGDDARLWLAPPFGEVTCVAEVDDQAVRRFLERHLRAEAGVRRRLPDRARRLVRTSRLTGAVLPRPALLAGAAGPPGLPPAYVVELARDGGVDLTGWRCGVSAPGRYSSKKVLCFLFPPGSDRPERIAKLTRHPAFNARLENEHRSLSWLRERWPEGQSTFPATLFLGHHAGLAVTGQTHVDGVPLRERASGRPDCPAVGAVLAWLADLARATVETVPPETVAAALGTLLERYAGLYRPAPGELAFLERQLTAIGSSGDPFPLVFQHGDPGLWNAVATGPGIAFLDWEAAEPRGMPLWDLFYFVRSVAPPGRGRSHPLTTVLLGRELDGYCERIGLSRDLASPLLYACWMHRALKEATRLPEERLAGGQFVTLLRDCIRDGTGLGEL
ncbi:MAG: hypothetical protein U0R69_12975 [Gaiellales bacterium]